MRFLAIGLVAVSLRAWGYGVGYSTHPLSVQQRMISAEATAIFNDTEEASDGGVGVQGRYTHKLTNRLVLDGGLGLSSGDRNFRAFVGGDLEIYPDYMKQPRISVKATLERAEELNETRTLLSAAPTISKGFSFWGHEAYPFAALPIGLSLEGDSKTYESVIGAAIGITSALPFAGMEQMNANFEVNLDLKDSFNGVFLGLSYPL